MNIFIKKVRNEIIRKLYRIPLLSSNADIAYKEAIAQHLNNLPPLSENDDTIVKHLKEHGILITSLAELSIPSTVEMFESANKLIPHIPTTINGNQSEFTIHASSAQMLEHSAIYLWGLQERLLNIVENYLGLSVAYHGAYFRRDLNNNIQKKSRLWHLDKEDRKMLKIIIYLHNVNEYNGVFQYISKNLTSKIANQLKYDDGYISDKIMQDVIPSSYWKSCIGSAGTVIFVDTANVFHRGKLPIITDRLSMFFDYTSRQPKHPFYCKSSLSKKDLITMSNKLSDKQKQYVFWQQDYN